MAFRVIKQRREARRFSKINELNFLRFSKSSRVGSLWIFEIYYALNLPGCWRWKRYLQRINSRFFTDLLWVITNHLLHWQSKIIRSCNWLAKHINFEGEWDYICGWRRWYLQDVRRRLQRGENIINEIHKQTDTGLQVRDVKAWIWHFLCSQWWKTWTATKTGALGKTTSSNWQR